MSEEQMDMGLGDGPAPLVAGRGPNRREAAERLVRERGLPLNQRAMVSLQYGPPCEGRLVLDEERIGDFAGHGEVRLRVGRVHFELHEIVSCIPLEG